MSAPVPAQPCAVAGHPLKCPVCGHDRFERRQSLLNTRWMTFFEFDWLNRKADNYVCERCGHVLWFLRRG